MQVLCHRYQHDDAVWYQNLLSIVMCLAAIKALFWRHRNDWRTFWGLLHPPLSLILQDTKILVYTLPMSSQLVATHLISDGLATTCNGYLEGKLACCFIPRLVFLYELATLHWKSTNCQMLLIARSRGSTVHDTENFFRGIPWLFCAGIRG